MKYIAGQRWTYQARNGEEDSRVTILFVDELPDYGVVVFAAVDGLRIKDATAPNGIQTQISFSAFTLEAFERSVVQLEGQLAAPDCYERHRCWRKAYDEGLAAPSTETVDDAVRTMQAICDRRNA